MIHWAIYWSCNTTTLIPCAITWCLIFPEPTWFIISNKDIIVCIFKFQENTKTWFACFRFFFESEIYIRIPIRIHSQSLFFKQGWFAGIVILICWRQLIVSNTIFLTNGYSPLLFFSCYSLPFRSNFLWCLWLSCRWFFFFRLIFFWLFFNWFFSFL